MNNRQEYKEALEKLQEALAPTKDGCKISGLTRDCLENIFPELKESEDEKIRKELIAIYSVGAKVNAKTGDISDKDIVAWLEKQGNKSINIDVESMVSSYEQRLISQGGTKYSPLTNMCLTAFRHGVENVLEELNLKKLEKQDENKTDFSNIRVWKYIVDMVLTEKDGIGNYLDNPDTERIAKILQEKYGNIEKQSEKKSTDKVEPKFKSGDWIVHDMSDGRVSPPRQIIALTDKIYILDGIGFNTFYFKDLEKSFRKWTIADAKDGDVLATDNFIFIFKSIDNSNGVHYHCHYEISKHEDDSPRFDIALPQSLMGIVGSSFTHYKPATKEQRELLFQKMKEAGYEWDSKKKELKKIEPKTLDPDNVIEWLTANVRLYASLNFLYGSDCPQGDVEVESLLKAFKKDFGL